MKNRIPKKRSFLIALVIVMSLLASASYSVAMPLVMASSECTMESTHCDMCSLMGQPESQAVFHPMSLLSLLQLIALSVTDSIPLPFYHPPG